MLVLVFLLFLQFCLQLLFSGNNFMTALKLVSSLYFNLY